MFKGVHGMSTNDGRPLIIDAGPGTNLTSVYRARVFQSDAPLKEALCRPDRHLGPPASQPSQGGRMNAHGISVFYGTNEPSVAIAEVRPPVGSNVAVARFEITRPLRLLDLTAVEDLVVRGSIFNPNFAPRLEHVTFLRSLARRITQPVMPDDEAIDYLPTQAIADFLATECDFRVDGIVFPSIQSKDSSLNVVLFHKAALVESVNIPRGIKIEASAGELYEEGWVTEYEVWEEGPPDPIDAESRIESNSPWNIHRTLENVDSPCGNTLDWREPTLQIDMNSISVHEVQQVEFTTRSHRVARHRLELAGREQRHSGDPSVGDFPF